eukprot:11168703-Lingulodinium_polyedra.AAC.1
MESGSPVTADAGALGCSVAWPGRSLVAADEAGATTQSLLGAASVTLDGAALPKARERLLTRRPAEWQPPLARA